MIIPMLRKGSCSILWLVFILSSCQNSSNDSNIHWQTDGREWLLHGLDLKDSRCSPLDQINTANVDSLGLLWSYDLGLKRGVEATPIVSEGIMYFTGPWSKVFAIEATTGKEVWTFDPEVPRSFGEKGCCDVVNRGVALSEGKVYVGSFDGRLIALNAENGEKIWETLTIDQSKPYTITGAPRVIKDLVIIGNGGAELGVRGYFSAYDKNTGEMKWRFYTVPGDPSQPAENKAMQNALSTWTGEWWKYGGGGTAWDAMSYDPELNLLYVGTGNGSPWDRNKRSPDGGDNLYLSSILAINPDNGELKWYYQTTPGDSWDFTATQHIMLADLEIDGKLQKVLMQAPKNGFFYVINRETGKLISAEKFTYVNWAEKIDKTSGKPVEHPLARYASANMDIAPNYDGAHNWHPMAYNTKRQLVYIPARETYSNYGKSMDWEYNTAGFGSGAGWNLAIGHDPGVPTIKDSLMSKKGKLIAWDPIAQKEAWHIDQENVWNGGVLTTLGDLVFQGTADGYIKAYHASDGSQLWQAYLGTGIMAPPVTYMIDGRQYLSVLTGWGGGYGMKNKHTPTIETGKVFTFVLGGDQKLPEPVAAQERRPIKPRWEIYDYEVNIGAGLFNKYCAVCHVSGNGSGGVAPNLAFSPHIGSPTFDKILLEGLLLPNGMPSYQGRISEEESHAIQTFIMATARVIK